jgi:ABC-type multidrug transport system fused ATPase/permease subunit
MRRFWGSGVQPATTARRLLGHLFRESRTLVVLGVATAAVESAVLVPIALVVRHVFNTDLPRHRSGSIAVDGATILALYAASAAFGLLSRVVALRITAAVDGRLRIELLSKLYELPMGWHDRHRAGPIHAIAVQDTERVSSMLATISSQLLPAAVVGFALAVVALLVNPLLCLTVLVVVVPLMVGSRLLTRRMSRLTDRWAESSSRFSSQAMLALRAMATTKVLGGEEWELQRGTETAEDLAERRRAAGVAAAASQAIHAALAATAGSAVLIVGGIAVAHHTMSLGSLLAFYAVVALLLRQLSTLGWQSYEILVGLQAMDRIEALLRTEATEPVAAGGRRIEFSGGIALTGVGFGYDDARVLHEVDLTFRPSEHLALIGPNGVGKSTVVSLILGLYRPQAGRLLADDVPYEELDIRSLRRQIGVVLQDPVILPGTIAENIAYARPDATEDAIRTAAANATAAEFIEDLKDGYATIVGDEGSGLSGGQRQRIAIARALLGAPALLVLDEPTTYLDESAMTTLLARLMSLPQSPTVLLVTHDPQVAGHVERVIELRDGRVVSDLRTVSAA